MKMASLIFLPDVLKLNVKNTLGSVWDLGDVSNTFAPDGNIRTALTMGVIDESQGLKFIYFYKI